MRRISRFVIAGLAVIIPVLFWVSKRQAPARAEQKAVPGSLVLLASPGRVEGQGETISLGAGADGVVKSVLVTDGQKVTQGTILAVLSCDDRKAEIDRARAEAESARQSRIRLLRGHRDEGCQKRSRGLTRMSVPRRTTLALPWRSFKNVQFGRPFPGQYLKSWQGLESRTAHYCHARFLASLMTLLGV